MHTNDKAACGANAAALGETRANVFCYPSVGSVKSAVLADLLAGQRITHLDVWKRHGSSRASHHVLMLRRIGWPITTTEIDAPTSDGRTARIASYSLPSEAIATAGLRAQRYVRECAVARRERRAGA